MKIEVEILPPPSKIGKITCDHAHCFCHAKFSVTIERKGKETQFVNLCSSHVRRALSVAMGF